MSVDINEFRGTVTPGKVVRFVLFLAFMGVIIDFAMTEYSPLDIALIEGSSSGLAKEVTDAGIPGMIMLAIVQCIQSMIVFAGESITQAAAGEALGYVYGSIIILAGLALASTITFWITRWLGQPLVQAVIPEMAYLGLRDFSKSIPHDVLMFLLYFQPFIPSGIFNYILPLGQVRFGKFILISTLARVPLVVSVTYAAVEAIKLGDGMGDANYWVMVTICAVLALVVSILYFRNEKSRLAMRRTMQELMGKEALVDEKGKYVGEVLRTPDVAYIGSRPEWKHPQYDPSEYSGKTSSGIPAAMPTSYSSSYTPSYSSDYSSDYSSGYSAGYASGTAESEAKRKAEEARRREDMDWMLIFLLAGAAEEERRYNADRGYDRYADTSSGYDPTGKHFDGYDGDSWFDDWF